MRVLVAGATGVMGRALLAQLNAAGYEAFGLARTPQGLLTVDTLGAKAVRGDVLDAEAMRRVLIETQPEAIVNLAKATPRRLRINPKDWEPNDRVLTEGVANLLAAAKEIGRARLFLQQSVGYVCASQGDGWIEENAPYSPHEFMAATRRMEALVQQSGVPSTLLRFAALMSADAWHTQQSIAALRRGLLPIVGDGSAYFSLIHLDDAIQALLCALANPENAAGQIFNVVDDEPARMREVLPFAARLLQAPAPRQIPPFLAKIAAGALTIEIFSASYRMTNAHIKQELGFTPRFPSYRELWTQIAAEVANRDFAPSEDLK
jgi:nucleoside-diphosphate-sugar epimerase